MSKKKPNQPQKPAAAVASPRATSGRDGAALPWNPVWRWLVSVLLAAHVLAVFVAPWDLSTEPALPPRYDPPQDSRGRPQLPPADSPVWQQPIIPRRLRSFFNHYLNLTYLNHGYQFFAPDPAGTHLIRYQVTKPDGGVEKGEFPNLEQQWPRLFYHRHMMLAEQTEMMGPESGQNYADHLASLHGGPSRMEWLIHQLLPPERVLQETPLDALSTYRVIATLDGRPRPEPSSSASGEGRIAIPGGAR